MTIPAGTGVPREARDFGGYELIAKLATGGMAEIFLARRRASTGAGAAGELLVVKRILPHLAEDDHFVTMFRDEAKLASRLEHPNVCRVETLGQAAGTWFIVMEYLHGIALSRVLTKLAKTRQFLDFRIAAAMIIQACEGLHHAHELRDTDGHPLGLVHRDVSPPNIFVTAEGMVKLLDFGIAKARGASSKTRTGTVKGKNAYMSPEQILGRPLDRRSDVFALGAVAYELLAVKRLFHRDSDFLTFKAITEEPIPDIRERRADIPAALRSSLTRALARDPNGRFASALEFAEAVKKAVSHLGGPVSPADLGRYVKTEFAEDLASKDRLIHDVDVDLDGPTVPSISALRHDESGNLGIGPTAAVGPRGRSRTIAEDIDYIGGELDLSEGDDMTRPLRLPSERLDRTPTMIVVAPTPTPATPTSRPPPLPAPPPTAIHRLSSLSGRQSAPPGTLPAVDAPSFPTAIAPASSAAIAAVRADATPPPAPLPLTLSPMPAGIAATTVELGDLGTDLLGYRMKRLRNGVLVAALAGGALIAAGFVLAGRGHSTSSAGPAEPVAAAAPTDARPAAATVADDPPADQRTRQDIIALSKFGFFSIDANAKTVIYIDGQRIGEAPLTRLPLAPGIHKVKAVGPHSKVKKFDIKIYATEDTEGETLDW